MDLGTNINMGSLCHYFNYQIGMFLGTSTMYVYTSGSLKHSKRKGANSLFDQLPGIHALNPHTSTNGRLPSRNVPTSNQPISTKLQNQGVTPSLRLVDKKANTMTSLVDPKKQEPLR